MIVSYGITEGLMSLIIRFDLTKIIYREGIAITADMLFANFNIKQQNTCALLNILNIGGVVNFV